MTAVIAPGIPQRPRLVLIPGGRDAVPPARLVPSPQAFPAAPDPADVLRLVPVVPPKSPRQLTAELLRNAGRVVVRRWALLAGVVVAGMVIIGGWMAVQAMGGVAGGGSLTPSGAPTSAASSAGTAGGAVHPTPGQAWVVQPGDTLWGIVQTAGVPGDPRAAVARLSAQLGGGPLQPGETVIVP